MDAFPLDATIHFLHHIIRIGPFPSRKVALEIGTSISVALLNGRVSYTTLQTYALLL